MAARSIKFEGKTYQFPDDATEQEISEALAGVHDQGPPANVTADPRMENPITDAHISPPESGIGGFLNRKLASVKTALGGNKPERGSGSAAVDLLGGPAIGPLHVAHGVTRMPRHPVEGFNEAVGGVAQTASLPLAVAAPAAIPMSLPYVAGAKAGAWGLTQTGMDPDNAEALSNLVTMGVAGRGPLIRGTGNILKKVGGSPDIPDMPIPGKAGIASRIFNAVKRPVGQAGRRMANYGVPQAPNVFDGDASGPLPGEPDLPTPVKPDGVAHHNDVTDQLELDKLLDQVSQQPGVRQGRDSVQADRMPHHDDLSHIDMTPPRESNVQSQSPSEDLEGMAQRQGIDLGKTTPVKGADDLAEDPAANIPTPNSDTLLRAIRSAPGWPENGLPNDTPLPPKGLLPAPPPRRSVPDVFRPPDGTQPEEIPISSIDIDPNWLRQTFRENIEGRGSMTDGPVTLENYTGDEEGPHDIRDGYHRIVQAIQDGKPTIQATDIFGMPFKDLYKDPILLPQSGSSELGRALDTDPYNRPSDQQVQSPNYSGAERRGFTRSVGGLSDAADNDDFQTAKRSLGPDASISQITLEAQRLKMKRAKGGK